MKPDSAVSAIVLAAGMSTRMQRQKQLAPFGGKTLLESTLTNVRDSGVREIVLVLGAGAGAVRDQLTGFANLSIVINEGFQSGMGTSLQTGLTALDAQSSAALVVLGDQPLVKPTTLDRLIAEYEAHKPQILIPLYRGFRGNPVLLDRSVFPEIAALNGDMGCRAIFGDHLENIRKLEVDDPGVVLDVDRMEDLEAIGNFQELPEMEGAPAADTGLLVVGREAVASALVRFAHILRMDVTVFDPLLTLKEMPEATRIVRRLDSGMAGRYCVVASMGRCDEEAIALALKAGIPYIALVANKKRSEEVLASLRLQGVPQEKLASVRTKAGIAIGAQTPQEIALSLMAEIVSVNSASTSPVR